MEITINIPDADVDLICLAHDWTERVLNTSHNSMLPETDDNMRVIPNPVSKQDHLKTFLIREIVRRLGAYKLRLAKGPIDKSASEVNIT